MRDAIKEDACRLICRFERLLSGRSDCAAIMRQVAVFCLSARYSSYSSVCDLLEKYLAKIERSLASNVEPPSAGVENVA
jgi:hypothetical protein